MTASRKKQNIGLFGGTFDPIHNGHLITAECIKDICNLDQIVFMPTNLHALKNNKHISSVTHRVEMLKLAIQDNPSFTLSLVEIENKTTSYTIDTIQALNEQYNGQNVKLHFLMGADNVNQLHQWKSPNELLDLCKIIAFGRPGAVFLQADSSIDQQKIEFVEIPLLEISSTLIREKISEGKSIRYLVPDAVERYIKNFSLYRDCLL